ncbi:alpha/beta fold hydrolase [Micromonospora sp. NPDC048169]|uniref:alpha/beta fold hydrolase n=1 Tax=unclassified Micromonospora TaxID=2617518 RepID=UPI0033EB0387
MSTTIGRRTRHFVAAAMVGVLMTGAGATASAAATTRIAWGACADPDLAAAGARCGFLTVPLDYARPRGATIQLAVSRIPHTTPDSQYQGVMLTNPGGPGGSGLGLAALGQAVPDGAGDAYDWIGLDPRGVGSSVPAISCRPDYFAAPRPPYVPGTPAVERAWLSRTRGYARACAEENGPLLRHMTTLDSARDLESLRIALGARQINYLGYSYGTYLGQVYASVYPARVRRMVLDSTVDPRTVWYRNNLDQSVAFERNIRIWFGWLARYDSVYHLGSTAAAVEKLFYQKLHELDRQPAGGVVGGAEWSDIFVHAGYNQYFWTQLAGVFAGWVHDQDADTLIGWYQIVDGPGDDNGYAAYNAVSCTDAPWPRNWATWQRDLSSTFRTARFLTWLNGWYNAPCLSWPAPAGRAVDIDGRRVASVLLVNETLDAATPFGGSLEVRRRFPHSRLLAVPGGTSHASGFFVGNECVNGVVATYLATGALPARQRGNGPDATCAPLPQPVPGPAATAQASGIGAARSPLGPASVLGTPSARRAR